MKKLSKEELQAKFKITPLEKMLLKLIAFVVFVWLMLGVAVKIESILLVLVLLLSVVVVTYMFLDKLKGIYKDDKS